MRVRPRRGTVEERAERIVRVRDVDVAELREASRVVVETTEVGDRDLDVDDGLGSEAGNRGGAVVIDAYREIAHHRREPVTLRRERRRPRRIIRGDREGLAHPLATRSRPTSFSSTSCSQREPQRQQHLLGVLRRSRARAVARAASRRTAPGWRRARRSCRRRDRPPAGSRWRSPAGSSPTSRALCIGAHTPFDIAPAASAIPRACATRRSALSSATHSLRFMKRAMPLSKRASVIRSSRPMWRQRSAQKRSGCSMFRKSQRPSLVR